MRVAANKGSVWSGDSPGGAKVLLVKQEGGEPDTVLLLHHKPAGWNGQHKLGRDIAHIMCQGKCETEEDSNTFVDTAGRGMAEIARRITSGELAPEKAKAAKADISQPASWP